MSSTVRFNYTSLQWRYHCFRDARKCFRSEASVLFAGDSRIRRKYFAFCDFINDDRFRNASKKVKHGRNWMYDRELKLTVVNNINKTYVCKKNTCGYMLTLLVCHHNQEIYMYVVYLLFH